MALNYFRAANGAHKKRNIAIILVALLLLSSVAGIVAAKYVSNYHYEAVIHASNFHFSSNYLNSDNTIPSFNVSDWGSNNITFYLYNYEVKNVAQISDADIRYTISVDNGWTVMVEDSTGVAVQPNNGEYTFAKKDMMDYHKVTLTGDGSVGDDIDVSVVTTSPYTKTMRAKFNLTTKKTFEYFVEDKGNYAVVTVSTNDFYGTLFVDWNHATHSPDNTSSIMVDWRDNDSNCEMQVEEYTTYTMIFVEKGTQDSSKENFTITGA